VVLSNNQDIRSAKELMVGQHCRLISRWPEFRFVVVSLDHTPGNPFASSNIRVQRLVRNHFGFFPLGWKKVGSRILLDPNEEVILV